MTVDLTFTLTPADGAAALPALSAGPTPRTLHGLAMPLGVPSEPSQDGHRYQFNAPPTNADELIDVVREHDDNAVLGRLHEPFAVTESALDAVARIFNTTAGNDVLEEVKEAARAAFSLGVRVAKFTTDTDGIRQVSQWSARHLGVVRNPAFTATRGVTVNASAHTPTEEPPMTTSTVDAATDATDATGAGPQVEQLPTVAELAAKVADHLSAATGQTTHPLAAFATFGEFMDEFRSADQSRRDELVAAFAIPDQTTANNAGVIPPGWRTEIKMNLDARRPAIAGTGGSISLPDAGMDSNWPYFDGNLDDVIKQQANEKDELSGVRIDIKKASEPIKTAGTVSDISYQLLMRSSPSYLQAYMRICMAAWARYTEKQFETALVARGTNAGALDVSTAAKARAALFAASADVEDATGAPADLVLVDRATFVALGGLDALVNPKYGTQNVAGTSDANTLRINVNGLEVVRAPFFGANTMVVTNGEAARFPETGPKVATEEEVTKLGRNVAVWGMYEDAEVYFPAGVRVYKPAA